MLFATLCLYILLKIREFIIKSETGKPKVKVWV